MSTLQEHSSPRGWFNQAFALPPLFTLFLLTIVWSSFFSPHFKSQIVTTVVAKAVLLAGFCSQPSGRAKMDRKQIGYTQGWRLCPVECYTWRQCRDAPEGALRALAFLWSQEACAAVRWSNIANNALDPAVKYCVFGSVPAKSTQTTGRILVIKVVEFFCPSYRWCECEAEVAVFSTTALLCVKGQTDKTCQCTPTSKFTSHLLFP